MGPVVQGVCWKLFNKEPVLGFVPLAEFTAALPIADAQHVQVTRLPLVSGQRRQAACAQLVMEALYFM